jgi:hypothetical protein
MKPGLAVLCLIPLLSGCQLDSHPGPTAPSPIAPPPAPAVSGPVPIPGTPLAIGETADDRVAGDAPNCFYQWDASGRCRQVDVVPDRRGRLAATLSWAAVAGTWAPDVFIVTAAGVWVAASDSDSPKSVHAEVEGGLPYRIVVLSYLASGQEFRLKTELVE